MKSNISSETQEQALKLARATQSQGQTKEQTKLIAQGIEKGIAEYKKLHKAKARERDKLRKQQLRSKSRSGDGCREQEAALPQPQAGGRLPWVLLGLSWVGFIAFVLFSHG
ncbi:DUF2956 domain-containing protein [Shewanella sp. AS16]|uniref:DUF2956 domain-containing protein n=1 Tax=Shewanella sp. AS16 TaxID=2907625 RepID=UPI001F3B3CC3|nr:DUF2956 domain-containing protein [Shewanella sp. AS16]MCE9685432.1 DUF2956 domain-containing protein [Shewanella sp. AS16]